MAGRKIRFVRKPNGRTSPSSEPIDNGNVGPVIDGPNSDAIDVDGIGGEDSEPITVDPASIDGNASDGNGDASGTRKRGRPRGSKNASKKASAQGLEKILLGIHGMLAVVTHTPELELANDEAGEIAGALKSLQEYYGDSNLVIPEWVIVWGALVIACGKVYGPRAIAISNRIAREKAEKGQPTKVTVIDGNAFSTAGQP